jgi:hypothetical protein
LALTQRSDVINRLTPGFLRGDRYQAMSIRLSLDGFGVFILGSPDARELEEADEAEAGGRGADAPPDKARAPEGRPWKVRAEGGSLPSLIREVARETERRLR